LLKCRSDDKSDLGRSRAKFVACPPRVKSAGYKKDAMGTDLSQFLHADSSLFMRGTSLIGKSQEVRRRVHGFLGEWGREVTLVEAV
jgi:hypothetical protein